MNYYIYLNAAKDQFRIWKILANYDFYTWPLRTSGPGIAVPWTSVMGGCLFYSLRFTGLMANYCSGPSLDGTI